MEHDRSIDTPEADQTGETSGVPAGMEAFSIGESINDRYSVVTRMSEGSTGKLYRTRSLKTGGEVTLKLLLGWPPLDDAHIRQLSKELSETRALPGPHSNIAQVLDCDVTPDGRAFLVMEGLEGCNLAELIRWREPLSVERALRLALGIAEGLQAAHKVGLVHGALSAEHVFVQTRDRIKIVGFEVARVRAAGRTPSRGLGDQSEGLDKAADTRAVAMVLLEMLTTGVRPGPGGENPSLEAPRGGEVPAAIKQLVMQFLVKSPDPSSSDMGLLVRVLAAAVNPPPERPISRAWQRRARPRRQSGQWALRGATALTLVVSASLGWMVWSLVAAPRLSRTHETPAGPVAVTRQTLPIPVDPARPAPVSVPDALPPQASDSSIESPVIPPPAMRPPAQASDSLIESPVTSPPAMRAPPEASDSFSESPVTPPLAGRAEPMPPPPPESAGSTVAAGAIAPGRAKLPAKSPAVDGPPPAATESARARPRAVGRQAAGSDLARSDAGARDPSAIIDWLIGTKSGPSEQP